MCLAIPAKVTELRSGDMGVVELGGVEREVSLALVDAEVGDYVVVHVGIAISVIDAEEAEKTIQLFAEMNRQENVE